MWLVGVWLVVCGLWVASYLLLNSKANPLPTNHQPHLEFQLEASEGCESGHVVAAVYHVVCIGDVLKTHEEVDVSAYLASQFEIEQGIILLFHIVGNIETGCALEVGGNVETAP